MMQEQKSIFPLQKRGMLPILQELLSRRLVASALLALGMTLILVLLELVSFLLLSPRHIFMFPFPFPLTLVLLLVEFALLFVGAFLAVGPLAILLYLHAVRRKQEDYERVYRPVTSITNIKKIAISPQGQATSTTSTQNEHVSLLNLVEQNNAHQVLLGMPGTGKTMALQVYQRLAVRKPFSAFSTPGKIPVYIPMRNYSLFLKRHQSFLSDENSIQEDLSQVNLLRYLMQSDLSDKRWLKGYIAQLFRQGRLLLLCDGLNEIASDLQPLVSEELVRLMRVTRNHFVVTCREGDYRQQPDLMQLVEDGQAACAVITPLRSEQIAEFVERYIERQDKQWKHTAGQIMSVIERSRLRYYCTNPLLLFLFMCVIDKIGVERGKQIDTRGLLLREYVRQQIDSEQKRARGDKGALTEQGVIGYLSEIAYAARCAHEYNAIQLIPKERIGGSGRRQGVSFAGLADELGQWLTDHPARTALTVENEKASSVGANAPHILQLAYSAGLIEVSADHMLSFRHELIAEYLVAEYFCVSTPKNGAAVSVYEELLEDVGRWSGPIALWAGLLDEPLELAEHFGALGLQKRAYLLPALVQSLVCIGVLVTPPQADVQRAIVLSPDIKEGLSLALEEQSMREALARIFTLCAEEGGIEIYRSLLPLIMLDSAEELLPLLEQNIVTDLLFTQLQDAIDNGLYEAQVKRIARVLGRFDGAVVERGVQLSQPAPERSPRLRAAVINMLGGTNDAGAVNPLVARLRDSDTFIVERAINALIRLGPTLALDRLLQELASRAPDPLTMRVHQAVLLILERFISEQEIHRQPSLQQYQSILEYLLPVLAVEYQSEPEVQRQAQEILIRQGLRLSEGGSTQDVHEQRWSPFIETLLSPLSAQDDVAIRHVGQVLEAIGASVVPDLVKLLQSPSDSVHIRAIDILDTIHDTRALPGLLALLADHTHAVQQRVARTLRGYAPASILPLIDVVLHDSSDTVADRAAQVLVEIGQSVVGPVTDALPNLVPGRTRFLVQILELIHDPRSIGALISLLEVPELEALLVVSLVRALGQFPDKRVVAPLLGVLSTTNPQFYEEAITALSQLGALALQELIAALDVDYESAVVQRVRRAILGMSPFPGEQLMRELERSTSAQTEQILQIFRMRGRDGATVLVRYLLHPNQRLRITIEQTLEGMPGSMVVPGLLAVLTDPALRETASTLLLKYPDVAILPLVDALGEQERGPVAAALLPRFGTVILRSLLVGLDDQRSMARELAQRALIGLVRQGQEQDERTVLQEIVLLFGEPLPIRAREAIMSVLTNELAAVSLPILLEGLEDVRLIEAVAEALTRLVNRPAYQERVLDALINALSFEDRRSGAEIALIRIGAPAVPRVGELITAPDPVVARSAMRILSEIGVPALSFIWTAYSDRNNQPRREAARAIFHSMPPEVIKEELISLLVGENRDDIAMAIALLLERIDDEARMDYQYQVMVPELIEYVETHNVQETNLRIVALLLLLGEQAITDHLIQVLDENPNHRKLLTYMLLFLGPRTHALLLEVFADPNMSSELRADIAGVLSMLSAPQELTRTASQLSDYGLSSMRAGALFSEELALALRALGGLLVSGQWNPRTLMELRDARDGDDPGYELFNVLLGWRYTPQIEKLQNDMDAQRDMFKKELLALTAAVAEKQQQASSLETELEKMRQEHGVRGDELQKAVRERDTIRAERDALRANVEQLTKEKDQQRITLEETTRRYSSLLSQYQGLQRQLQGLSRGPEQELDQGSGPGRGQGQISRPQNIRR